jgi:hypothetical protein
MIQDDLIDQLPLMIYPVVAGSGKRLRTGVAVFAYQRA